MDRHVENPNPFDDQCPDCKVLLDVELTEGGHVWSICGKCGWTSPRRRG